MRPGLAELAELRPVIVSAGFHELIEPVLGARGSSSRCSRTGSRHAPDGWRVRFRDRRLRQLRRALQARRRRGAPYVYVGDGYSDRCAALAAERVFARDALAALPRGPWFPYEPFRDSRTSRDASSRTERRASILVV